MTASVRLMEMSALAALHDWVAYDGHEALFEGRYPAKNDICFLVALHSTRCGPGLGGIRVLSCDYFAAVHDVLRLSYAMSIKAVTAGISYGGAKSVLVCERSYLKHNREKIFRWVGDCVESLCGRYIAAEDMGTTSDDLQAVYQRTAFVRGFRAPGSGKDADFTSSMTARGVLAALGAAIAHVYGESTSLKGLVFSVQGCLGKVGFKIACELMRRGGIVNACDIAKENAIGKAFDAAGISADSWRFVLPDDIYRVAHDVFVPCAIGNVINASTVGQLDHRCRLVCGCANNQLGTLSDARNIAARGKLYIPDFVANAGGLIACANEDSRKDMVMRAVDSIGERVARLIDESGRAGELPAVYAEEKARAALGLPKKEEGGDANAHGTNPSL